MKIDVTYDSSVAAAPAKFKSVIADVVNFYDAQFANPITINIDVGWGEVDGQALSASALGESISRYTTSTYTYAQIKSALDASATNPADKSAVNSLPAVNPTPAASFSMTTAEAKALGLAGTGNGVDGWAGFANTKYFGFGVTSNAISGQVGSTQYDFFGVVAHEFSEILGRQMNFVGRPGGSGGGSDYPLDLFNYSAPGVLSSNPVLNHYFSMDAGATELANFNIEPSGDLFDWEDSQDSFDAFCMPGLVNFVSNTDLQLMNVLGYQLKTDLAMGAQSPMQPGSRLSYTISNDSALAAPASTAGVYLSSSSTVTTAGIRIASQATPAVAVYGSVSKTLTLTMPASVPAGAYYMAVIANADGAFAETDSSNNVSKSVVVLVLDDANLSGLAAPRGGYAYDTTGVTVDQNIHSRFEMFVSAPLGGAGSLTGGALDLEPGAQLTIANLAGVELTVETSLTYAGNLVMDRDLAPYVTVSAGKTLTLSGDNSLSTVEGPGDLVLSGGSDAFNDEYDLSVSRIQISGGASVAAPPIIYSGRWLQTDGKVSVASALTLTAAADRFSGRLAGAGTIDLTGAGDTLKNLTLSASAISINAASVNLGGSLDITSVVNLTSPAAIIKGGGVTTLIGGGTLQLSNLASNTIVGANSASVLQNNGVTIAGAGDLSGGELQLINGAGGVIDGDQSNALTIDTGEGPVVNAGLISASRASKVVIAGGVANAGKLAAFGGNLTVDGAVTGSGTVRINDGTADFAARFSQNVAFTGPGGVLELGRSQAYGGTIWGFSKRGATALDLDDIEFVSAGEASFAENTARTGGVLTVADGTHTARITLAGNYSKSAFIASSDGHGGTWIVDPPAPAAKAVPTAAITAATHAFVAAAASFGATAASAPAETPHARIAAQLMLAAGSRAQFA